MPLVKCRFCHKERRVSLGAHLLSSEANELHVLCQPSCFKMLHSRGTFTDLNQKDVLVPSSDIFRDMDLQLQVAANPGLGVKHREENAAMRRDVGQTPPVPMTIHKPSVPTISGCNDGEPHPTSMNGRAAPSTIVSPGANLRAHHHDVSNPVPSDSAAPRHAASDMNVHAYPTPSLLIPPPRHSSHTNTSLPSTPPTMDMSALYMPPLRYTSSLRSQPRAENTAKSTHPGPTASSQSSYDPACGQPPSTEPSTSHPRWTRRDLLGALHRFHDGRRDDLDARNNVIRLDVTAAMKDRSLMSESEVATVMGCLERVELLVVLQGLASTLTTSYWTLSFLFAALPPHLLVHCDHYRADRNGNMTYVSSVMVPLSTVRPFFLHGSPVQLPHPDGAVVVGSLDDGLTLQGIELAFHAPRVHANLTTAFGWNLFAGGPHCWMQYMPSQYRDPRRFEPKIHFGRPTGQRSELLYSGNGSTDTAYQVVLGEMELVVFDPMSSELCNSVVDILKRMGYHPNTRADLSDKFLHNLNKFGFNASVVRLVAGELVHVHKGRLHMWRSVGSADVYSMLVFISWEWVFQGVTPEGLQASAKSAVNTAVAHYARQPPPSLSPMPFQFVFNPRNCILEAARQWLALSTLETTSFGPIVSKIRAILPVVELFVDEEQAIHRQGDDSWFLGAHRRIPNAVDRVLPPHMAVCRMCSNELSNTYKQCLGCTVFEISPPFVICIDCFRMESQFEPKTGIRSSAGHTGSLPQSQAFKERSGGDFPSCTCSDRVQCGLCDGCDQCSCLCHTMFATRHRLHRPDDLMDLHHLLVARTTKDSRRL
ncbi:hypothetical protein, variant 1 [Aphanomyces invadans]|uniref:Uncharacterized protein n=1 Tax=Aphanomyces invadans TaxID=157072 RepID=A0A024TSF6_9STRA|nr:hypothetical protein, variant 1 [Aphanomyces invadans]ETV96282.1 hypothetical protein, variant 1 [Aphanomyces invadans]|eukprot:XP_008875074.1 hypothetical protein, variant 1 [Aphanomyces invadans]